MFCATRYIRTGWTEGVWVGFDVNCSATREPKTEPMDTAAWACVAKRHACLGHINTWLIQMISADRCLLLCCKMTPALRCQNCDHLNTCSACTSTKLRAVRQRRPSTPALCIYSMVCMPLSDKTPHSRTVIPSRKPCERIMLVYCHKYLKTA
jgi:hypothetical protein